MLPLRAGVAMQHTSIGPRSIAAVGHFFVYRTSARNLSIASVSPMRPVPSNGSHQAGTLPAGQQACFGAQPTRSRTVTAPALAASATAASSVVPDPWHTLAVLSTCAAVSQLLESHTKWGAMLSAPLLALTAALAAAAMGLLPAVSPVYDAVWRYLMPLAVALYLLDQDITSLASSGGQVLLSFLLGAGTMLAGAWCAWKLLGAAALGPHGAQLVCCLLASYIGGSVNFAAVAAATELPKALMPAAVAADNLAMLVLLGAMMATPVRVITALTAAKPTPAAAGAAGTADPSQNGSSSSSSRSEPEPSPPIAATSSALQQSRPVAAALGLDGRPLLTEPPDAAAVEACMQASALGRAAVSSSSSSSYRSSGSFKQHALSHRAVGKYALDGGLLLTPDPQPSSSSSRSGAGAVSAAAAAVAGNSTSRKTGDGSSSNGNGTSGSSSSSSSKTSSSSSKCAGCRASGVTALDDNPLLTQAPAMGDAISTINAARQGKQRLRTGPPPGSSSSSSGSDTAYDRDHETADSTVVGCGCCEEALNAMAAASSSRSPYSSSSSNQKSGALGIDGGLLMTDDPGEDQLAAAVAAAKAGKKAKSANVSVSGSALSSLASTDSDDLELVVRFNWREFQQKLKKEKQQQQQQQQSVLPAEWEKISVSSSVESSDDEALLLPSSAAGCGSSSSGVSTSSSGVLTSSSGAAALAAAIVACAAGQSLASWFGVPALQLLLLSCCALGLSVAGNTLFSVYCKRPPQQQQQGSAAAAAAAVGGPFAGAGQLGQLLMGVFFATLGASCCCSWSSFTASAPQFAFIIIMVAVHWGLLAALGRVLGPGGLNIMPLSGEVLMVGSAANVGGPATAAALAAAKGWDGLVQPALLCGSLGYALGTAGGMLLARSLGVLPG